jgi:uncharacterized protein (TIGR02268 family)
VHLSLSTILVLSILHGSPDMQLPSPGRCPEVRTIELSLSAEGAALEICVSPGLMTGFVFDAPADIDLQDEPRFIQVLRGRSGVSFVPPREMAPGERLRLIARLGVGSSQQFVPFTLVAHSAEATRQVEVYRDERPRASLEMEVRLLRARNQRLREENAHLQVRLEHHHGLRGLLAGAKISLTGVQARHLPHDLPWQSDGGLELQRASTYRAEQTIAVQVWINNLGSDTWRATGVALVDAKGQGLSKLDLFQPVAFAANGFGVVVVETETKGNLNEPLTLKLWCGPRAITVPDIFLPSPVR